MNIKQFRKNIFSNKTYSDEISDLKQIEEGPEERDEEAGDDDEEEPVIVTDAIGTNLKVSSSWVETDPRGWSCTRHANDAQYLEINQNNEAHIKPRKNTWLDQM